MRCSKIGGLNGPDTSPQSALRFGAAAAVGTLPTLRPPATVFRGFHIAQTLCPAALKRAPGADKPAQERATFMNE